MSRSHPFRLFKRTVGSSQIWYAVLDNDPAHPRSTGVRVSGSSSRDNAVAAAYALLEHGPRIRATIRDLTEDMFTDACRYRRRIEQKRRGRPYSFGYWSQHRGRLTNYIWPRFGGMQPAAVTAPMIDDWLLDLDNARGIAISAGQGNKIIQTLRLVFKELHYREIVPQNAAMKVGWFAETARRMPFTLAEVAKLFPEDMDELIRIWLSLEWATYFYLMLTTGVRPGEAAAFRLRDWVPGTGAVVHESIDADTRRVKGLKTEGRGAVVKPVVFNQRLEGFLTLLQYRNHEPDQLLFTVHGRALIPDVTQKHLKGATKRAGVDLHGRTQYGLRHTFVTETLKHADEKTVAKLAGHRTLRREYDHRKAADFLQDNPALRGILDSLF